MQSRKPFRTSPFFSLKTKLRNQKIIRSVPAGFNYIMIVLETLKCLKSNRTLIENFISIWDPAGKVQYEFPRRH
jgi:hypothetical protein